MHWINLHPYLLPARSELFPGSIGMWQSPSPQSRAVGVSMSPPCLQGRKNNRIPSKKPSILLRKNNNKKKEQKENPSFLKETRSFSLSLSAKVPLVSKVQEVGGSTGRSPSGIPAFYPDPCWGSWGRSRNSHSYCSGRSEAVGGAEAEREEHPWSDSLGSPRLCKACEGALRGGGR